MPRSKQISFIVKISACLITFFILFFTKTVFPADVTLTWDRPNDCRVTGYKIFYGPEGTDFKSMAKKIIYDAAQTSHDIFNLHEGKTYGFSAKSMDINGNESVFSEVIFYNVPEMSDDSSNDSKTDNPQEDDNSKINDKIDESSKNNEKHGNGGGEGCFIHSFRYLSGMSN